jgi:hypothetical protein
MDVEMTSENCIMSAASIITGGNANQRMEMSKRDGKRQKAYRGNCQVQKTFIKASMT